jgi:PHS family inorganic phosphate transporter-like MFS transporter
MMSWVFFAQPVGQLLANVLSLAAVEAYRPWIEQKLHYCKPQDDECFRAIDRLWRLVVGIGIIPAVIALAFRFTIPESPRYTLDILQHPQKTFQDTIDFYPVPERHPEQGAELLPITPEIHVPRRVSISSEIGADEIIDSDSESDRRPSDVHLHHPAMPLQLPPGDPNFVPPLASWADAKQFFIVEGNWQYLLGTSLSWLFLDFACECLLPKINLHILTIDIVYGLGLSSPQIVSHIWEEPEVDQNGQPVRPAVYATLRDNSLHTLVMVSIGTITGGLLMIKIVKHVSPKVIQFWGFLVLFVLLIVTGSAWQKLLESSRSGLIVLYVLSHIAFNLGPNVTTFIVSSPKRSSTHKTDTIQIPAEIFPTRYRCTCHGIAAASGKLGSWLVQIFLAYGFKTKDSDDQYDWEKKHLGQVLQVMSAFMIAGAITTHFLVPETRDHDNKSRTLEVLACGKKVIDELNRKRKEEDDHDS